MRTCYASCLVALLCSLSVSSTVSTDWGEDPAVLEPLRSWITQEEDDNMDLVDSLVHVNQGWNAAFRHLRHGLKACPLSVVDEYLQPPGAKARPTTLNIDTVDKIWSVKCVKVITKLWRYHFTHIDKLNIWVQEEAADINDLIASILILIKTSEVSTLMVTPRITLDHSVASYRYSVCHENFLAKLMHNFGQFTKVKHLVIDIVPSVQQKTISDLARVLRVNHHIERLSLHVRLTDRIRMNDFLIQSDLDQLKKYFMSIFVGFIQQKTLKGFVVFAEAAVNEYSWEGLDWDLSELNDAFRQSSSLQFLDLRLASLYNSNYGEQYLNPQASLQILGLLVSAAGLREVELQIHTASAMLVMLGVLPHVTRLDMDVSEDEDHVIDVLEARVANGAILKELSWKPENEVLESSKCVQIVRLLEDLQLKVLRFEYQECGSEPSNWGKAISSLGSTLEVLEINFEFYGDVEVSKTFSVVDDLPMLRELLLHNVRPSIAVSKMIKKISRMGRIEKFNLSFQNIRTYEPKYWNETLEFISEMDSLANLQIFPSNKSPIFDLGISLAAAKFPKNLQQINGFEVPRTEEEYEAIKNLILIDY